MTLRDDISQRYGVPAHYLTADSYEGLKQQAEALATWRNTPPPAYIERPIDRGTQQAQITNKDYALLHLREYLNGIK